MNLVVLGLAIVLNLIQLYKWYTTNGGYIQLVSDILLASIVFATSNLIVLVLVSTIIFINIIIAQMSKTETETDAESNSKSDAELLVWSDSCDLALT